VIAVKRIQPAHQQSLDEAKAALELDLKAERAQDKLAETAKKIDDQLAGGAKLEEAGAPFGLKPVTVAPVDATGKHADGSPAPELKGHEDILKAVFAAAKDAPAQIQDGKGGSAFAVAVTDLVPPALRPLDSVRAKVVEAYIAEAKAAAATARANDLAAKAKAGTPFGALSKEANAIVVPVGPLIRDAKDSALGAGVVSALFDLGKAGDVTVAVGADGPVLVRLGEIIRATPKSPADTAPLERETAQQVQGDLSAQYIGALKKIYPVKLHDQVLEAMRQ
jgi:peptidyl-prolyl cis-trans isomerase D